MPCSCIPAIGSSSFFGDDGRLFLLSASRPIGSLKGMLPKPARPVSLEEMDAAIAASARP
jgi:hypothetical protein